MQYTNRLKLKKPDGTDIVNIEDINANMDIIESRLAGYIGFIIAAPDAVNKERADLILTGDPEADRAAIQNAINTLHNMRASTDVPVIIDFIGGKLGLGYILENDHAIYVNYNKIYLYFNGMEVTKCSESVGSCTIYVSGENCIIDGLIIKDEGSGDGIYIKNGTLINCYANCYHRGITAFDSILYNCAGTSDYIGIYVNNSKALNCVGIATNYGIDALNSYLSNCAGTSDYIGINANNSNLLFCSGISNSIHGIEASSCKLLGCTGSGYIDGIYAVSDNNIIIGCDGTDGGIYVYTNSSYPNTYELLSQFNKGEIVIVG